MDGQPDILSSGSRSRRGDWWPAVGRSGRIAVIAVCVVLACLGVITWLALVVAHRGATITGLRGALRDARHPAPATAAGPPVESGSALFTLPDAALGSFSLVAVVVRPRPGSAALTWLFVYGQHAEPGQHYGLLEGTCGGQYVTRLTWRTAPQTGTATSRSPRPTSAPARRLLISGSCCTDGRTARRSAASRVHWSAAVPGLSGLSHRADRAVARSPRGLRSCRRRSTAQLRVEPCGLSRQVVAFGEAGRRSGSFGVEPCCGYRVTVTLL